MAGTKYLNVPFSRVGSPFFPDIFFSLNFRFATWFACGAIDIAGGMELCWIACHSDFCCVIRVFSKCNLLLVLESARKKKKRIRSSEDRYRRTWLQQRLNTGITNRIVKIAPRARNRIIIFRAPMEMPRRRRSWNLKQGLKNMSAVTTTRAGYCTFSCGESLVGSYHYYVVPCIFPLFPTMDRSCPQKMVIDRMHDFLFQAKANRPTNQQLQMPLMNSTSRH